VKVQKERIGTATMNGVIKNVIQMMTLTTRMVRVYGITAIFQLENNATDIKIVTVKVTIV
jgi:hypothetical protein